MSKLKYHLMAAINQLTTPCLIGPWEDQNKFIINPHPHRTTTTTKTHKFWNDPSSRRRRRARRRLKIIGFVASCTPAAWACSQVWGYDSSITCPQGIRGGPQQQINRTGARAAKGVENSNCFNQIGPHAVGTSDGCLTTARVLGPFERKKETENGNPRPSPIIAVFEKARNYQI